MTGMSAAEAAALYRHAVVVDCLNGSALRPDVIARMAASGVTALNLTAVQIGADLAGALRDLAATIETVERHGDRLMLVRAPADVAAAKRAGKVGIILGMQDAEPIGRDLAMLRVLSEIGVRIIQITHNRRSVVGTGCVEADDGLSRFGRALVGEMNRLGLVVDVAHCGPRTTLDAIEHSALPVLCSHSNPSAVSPSPRNKSDEIIRRLAARGGVIGIAVWSPIVQRGDGRRPTMADVLDCLDHALALVGPDHVAIGTDLCEEAVPDPVDWARIYGPDGNFPEVTGGLGPWYGFATVNAEGIETIAGLPGFAAGMAERGHDAATIAKVLGGNFQRLFAAVTAARVGVGRQAA
ncbi:MAG: membrane dipeptidase [Alphaproteobacteria bacterium]|nr:membrane dipeptidase [Alphaproteobacteria bacterium]